RSDFNGDGYDELVVAIPGRDIDGIGGAGAIVIVPGGPRGAEPANATQIWHRASDGIPGDPAPDERWGMVIAAADFNIDGFFDLVIGSPFAQIDGNPNSGDVIILYGSEEGLRTAGSQHITPDAQLGAAFFGAALAIGAFNPDPIADLAVGAPGAHNGAGAVVVYHGALFGPLRIDTILTADMAAIEDPEEHSQVQGFGAALAAGAFNQTGTGTGRDDLVIATRQRDRGGATGPAAGRLFVAHGGTSEGTFGLAFVPTELLDLDHDVAPELVPDPSLVAMHLLAGDFNGDGTDDLAVGMPTAGVIAEGAPNQKAGAVPVIAGTDNGLAGGEVLLLLETTLGFRDDIEAGDEFGTAIAAGDFDNDGFADLAIGTPLEDDYGLDDRGTMHVVYGAENGLNFVSRRMTVHHDMEYYGAEISQADNGNMYGASLGVGDYNGDGFHDLALGLPGKSGPDGEVNAGWVLILYGGQRGVTTTFAEVISHETLAASSLGLTAAPNDYLGLSLSGGTSSCDFAALCMRLR
ncbi:MAG: hypothetical protein ACTSWI_07415, partial [Alphaproteobacteria bacterium]